MNPIAQIADAIIKNSLNEEQLGRYGRILEDKFFLALQTWALTKMDLDRKKYFALGHELFLTNLGGVRINRRH